jgi:hypothetical protein
MERRGGVERDVEVDDIVAVVVAVVMLVSVLGRRPLVLMKRVRDIIGAPVKSERGRLTLMIEVDDRG